MLKPIKANPVNNLTQRLSRVVNDDLFSLIKAFSTENEVDLMNKLNEGVIKELEWKHLI